LIELIPLCSVGCGGCELDVVVMVIVMVVVIVKTASTVMMVGINRSLSLDPSDGYL